MTRNVWLVHDIHQGVEEFTVNRSVCLEHLKCIKNIHSLLESVKLCGKTSKFR